MVGLRNVFGGSLFSMIRKHCCEIVREKKKTSEFLPPLRGAPERF